MKIFDINKMFKGWFVGDFDPAVVKTKEFELAHHFHEKGYVDKDGPHYHKVATEINYIIKGKVIVNDDHCLSSGDIFVYEPYDVSNVKFLEDTDLMVAKIPSVKNDKYLVSED